MDNAAAAMTYRLFDPLLERCRNAAPKPAAIVYPCSVEALEGAMTPARRGLIAPILVGPTELIKTVARDHHVDLTGAIFEEAKGPRESAQRAATLAREGRVSLLMKGSLHSSDLLSVVVSREAGLRTARRISHSFVMDIPSYPKLLHITDAVVNIAPNLETKRDIVQNSIDLCHALGVKCPKVAILSAIETVMPGIISTADAAELVAMSKAGQITGAEVEGPLAFDDAISAVVCEKKGIRSRVAGAPDVLVVPGIEAGNILFKALEYLAGAIPAGVVLGTSVPIVLTSRVDNAASRLVSVVVACASVLPR